MRGALAVLAVAGLLPAACSRDEVAPGTAPETVPTTAAPQTTLPPTTLPATTSAATTSPATTAPSTQPVPPTTAFVPGPPDDRWTPACVEQPAVAASAPHDEPLLDTFGPLGGVPALAITLPLVGSGEESDQTPTARVERVPGGLALLVTANSFGDAGGAILTVVGHDGLVRWRRCLDPGGVVYSLLAGGSTLLVGTYEIGTGERNWLAFDPLTGGDTEAPSEIDGLGAYPYGEHSVLLRHPDVPASQPIVASEEYMARFDRATGTIETVPYPPTADGQQPGLLEFAFSGDTPMQISNRVPLAVYDGRQWLTDRDSLVRLVEPEAMPVFTTDASVWVGRNGAGEELWRKPDWHDPGTEGFLSVATHGVTILRACTATDESGFCSAGVFAGVETATGGVLWEQPEQQAAAVAGDGRALVTTSDGTYVMIDARTGEPVDHSQVFPKGSFLQGCCGEDEVLWTGRRGGLVVAVDYENVTVWYPEALTGQTSTLELLG